ncbi:MAG: hypothetical protein CENE_00253 [Candidatus Celerinatantimonas neptuna]|nr:MAG: hypothetical protein CENE_00253 [Candidatus Celerinatantimonas neptuna]
MFLDDYFQHGSEGVVITPEQASLFAKCICRDFNPIHDPQAKRFCVPGDLLCALVLKYYGLSQNMVFKFTGMVNGQTILQFPEQARDGQLIITDQHQKSVLEVSFNGDISHDERLIEALVRYYGAFSGQNFPTLMMPLMAKHQVMFNPSRPLVMYDQMHLEFGKLDISDLDAELLETSLDVQGKRAEELLKFEFTEDGQVIGRGVKKLIVGGLKPYDMTAINAFADEYENRRQLQQSQYA